MKMLNTKEVAGRLGISLRRVQQMIEEKTLPAQKIGRDYVIMDGDLKSVTVYGRPGRPTKTKVEGEN